MNEGSSDLERDLQSTDPARVTSAIYELERRIRTQNQLPVSLPKSDVLDVLAEAEGRDHDELLARFLTVLRHYDEFVPVLTADERLKRGVDSILRYGGSYAARELSLDLLQDPLKGPAAAILCIATRGIQPGREAEQARRLLSSLLEDDRTRADVVEALRAWTEDRTLHEVLSASRARFEPEELSNLGITPAQSD